MGNLCSFLFNLSGWNSILHDHGDIPDDHGNLADEVHLWDLNKFHGTPTTSPMEGAAVQVELLKLASALITERHWKDMPWIPLASLPVDFGYDWRSLEGAERREGRPPNHTEDFCSGEPPLSFAS